VTSLDLQSLRQAHQQQEKVSADYLTQIRFLDRIDGWLQSLIDCHAFAVDCCRTKRTDYMEAYAIVSSAAFSNAESTRLLLLRGFYGNALADIRALASAADLVADLSLTEDSPSKWLRSRFIAPDDNSREAHSLRSYFKDNIKKHHSRRRFTALQAKLCTPRLGGLNSSRQNHSTSLANSTSSTARSFIPFAPSDLPACWSLVFLICVGILLKHANRSTKARTTYTMTCVPATWLVSPNTRAMLQRDVSSSTLFGKLKTELVQGRTWMRCFPTFDLGYALHAKRTAPTVMQTDRSHYPCRTCYGWRAERRQPKKGSQ